MDFNQVSFEILVHRYNILSLLCLVETALACQRSWSTDTSNQIGKNNWDSAAALTCQRSLSTDTQLQFLPKRSHFVDSNQVSFESWFTDTTFCHCCVW